MPLEFLTDASPDTKDRIRDLLRTAGIRMRTEEGRLAFRSDPSPPSMVTTKSLQRKDNGALRADAFKTLRIERPGTLTWRCTPFLLRDLRKHNALPSTGMPTFSGVSGRCCGIVAERCGDSLATISESTTLTGDINDHNSRQRGFKGPRHGVGRCHRQGDHHHSRPRGLEPLRLRTMGLHRESEDCRE